MLLDKFRFMFDKVQNELSANLQKNGKNFVPTLKFIPSSMGSSDNDNSMSISSRIRQISSRNTPGASAREIERVEEDSLESICSSANKKGPTYTTKGTAGKSAMVLKSPQPQSQQSILTPGNFYQTPQIIQMINQM